MPNRIETPALSEGDQTWLASTRGIYTNRTVKLHVADFTVDPALGYIPSGTPLAVVDAPGTDEGEMAVPYDAAGTTGTEKLAGFLFTDQRVVEGSADTYINAPLMDHGRIRISRLPVDGFTAPTAANDEGNFVYVTN